MFLFLLSILVVLFLGLSIVFIIMYFMKKCTTSRLGSAFLQPADDNAKGAGFGTVNVDKQKKEINVNIFIGEPTSSIITMSHIHVQNNNGTVGDPVVPLGDFSFTSPPVPNTLLVKNLVIKPSDFIGPLKNGTIDDFINMLSDKKLLINVHTKDYPKGEIQGALFFLT